MALKQTIDHMRSLLSQVTTDLHKAEHGNKAAGQRVRTGTIKLEKVAKMFRKESIKHEKTTVGKKKSTPKAAKHKAAAHKKHAGAKKTAAHHGQKAGAHHKKAAVKKKTTARAHAMSIKKRHQTAKLPAKRRAAH